MVVKMGWITNQSGPKMVAFDVHSNQIAVTPELAQIELEQARLRLDDGKIGIVGFVICYFVFHCHHKLQSYKIIVFSPSCAYFCRILKNNETLPDNPL